MPRFRIHPVATAILLTALAANGADAAEIRVPEDRSTIQSGIDAAQNGDTVSVAPGTYAHARPLLISGKQITLLGREGASATILEASGTNSLLTISNMQAPGLTVEGFTFRNGTSGNDIEGGCLSIGNAVATVRNNRFESCKTKQGDAGSSGGAIKVRSGANPLITGNVFLNNRSFSQGGAIHVFEATASITQNDFLGNIAAGTPESGGGGVKATFSVGPAVEVQGNRFENNEARFAGGAISAFASDMNIIDNIIVGNGNGRFGGGIHLETTLDSGGDRQFSVINNLIENNSILDVDIPDLQFDSVSGAGIHLNFGIGGDTTNAQIVIRDNVIRGNTATDSRCIDGASTAECAVGGGIVFFNALAPQTVTNNIIEGNVADVYGAANFDKVLLEFRNNLIANNRARFTHPGIGCVSDNNNVVVDCSIQRNRFLNNRYTDGGTGSGKLNDAGAVNIRRNNVLLANNLFADNFGHWATVFIRHEDITSAFSRIEHNTFVGNDRSEPNFGTLAMRGEASIRNNIFFGDFRAFRLDNATSSSTVQNNNITDTSNSVARFDSSVLFTIGDLNSQDIAEGNTALAPGFRDVAKRDYHLAEDSSLVDAVPCIADITDDLDGNPRPTGSGCDAGAFELVADLIFADGFES